MQDVANTASAFARVNYRDEQLFAALAMAAERRLSDVNFSYIQMALTALNVNMHLFDGGLFLMPSRTSFVVHLAVCGKYSFTRSCSSY